MPVRIGEEIQEMLRRGGGQLNACCPTPRLEIADRHSAIIAEQGASVMKTELGKVRLQRF